MVVGSVVSRVVGNAFSSSLAVAREGFPRSSHEKDGWRVLTLFYALRKIEVQVVCSWFAVLELGPRTVTWLILPVEYACFKD